MHTNPLIGTGFESFWMGSRLERVDLLVGQGIQEAHNGYLELYLNLGLAGVALLATLIVTGYRKVLAVLRRDPHVGRLRLAFFTAGVIYSLTEAGFRMMSPIWIAFLLAVTFVPPGLLHKKRQPAYELAAIQQASADSLPAEV
jgi:O-antigen ligase